MAYLQPLRSLLRTQTPSLARRIPAASVPATRSYTGTARLFAYKDDQDRNSLKPKTTEETQSGTASEAAAQDEAFDSSKTSPEEERRSANRDGSPLEVSGANQGVSKPQGDKDKEKEWQKGSTNKKSSRGGSPEKSGKPPI
ncbi:hypothetical protein NKR23_g11002 [Pleurostoma richardsiae]|uniref:Uncharacterized protein n=1 Tax=Pleurostoma richardsiae TaxID=41990 RepID=A0AA38R8Q0_9PEZI|nr:hypothetical protein NKR23_g11002 [Pleurostoma richardsiae]